MSRLFLLGLASLLAPSTETGSGGGGALLESPPNLPAETAVEPVAEAPKPQPRPSRPSLAEARSLLLATRPVEFELVAWPPSAPPGEQVQLALKRPPVGARSQIYDAAQTTKVAMVVDGKEPEVRITFDQGKLRAGALVACLHTVGPDGQPLVPVFTAVNVPELLSQPAGPDCLVDVLGARALRLLEGAPIRKEIEAAKNG